MRLYKDVMQRTVTRAGLPFTHPTLHVLFEQQGHRYLGSDAPHTSQVTTGTSAGAASSSPSGGIGSKAYTYELMLRRAFNPFPCRTRSPIGYRTHTDNGDGSDRAIVLH